MWFLRAAPPLPHGSHTRAVLLQSWLLSGTRSQAFWARVHGACRDSYSSPSFPVSFQPRVCSVCWVLGHWSGLGVGRQAGTLPSAATCLWGCPRAEAALTKWLAGPSGWGRTGRGKRQLWSPPSSWGNRTKEHISPIPHPGPTGGFRK